MERERTLAARSADQPFALLDNSGGSTLFCFFAAHLVALNVGWMGTLRRAFTLFVLFFFPVMLYHTLTDCWVEGNLFSFLPLALIWRYMNPQAGTASSPLFWGCCWCWATLKRYIFLFHSFPLAFLIVISRVAVEGSPAVVTLRFTHRTKANVPHTIILPWICTF